MTGFTGRIGIYETLVLTPAFKALVGASPDLARLRDQGVKDGMKPLRISGAMKVGAGLTTIEEVLKVAPPLRDGVA
jgi:general secretion pathway protein E